MLLSLELEEIHVPMVHVPHPSTVLNSEFLSRKNIGANTSHLFSIPSRSKPTICTTTPSKKHSEIFIYVQDPKDSSDSTPTTFQKAISISRTHG